MNSPGPPHLVELEHCPPIREAWITYAAHAAPDFILLVEGWAGVGAERADGGWVRPCDARSDRIYATHLEALVGELSRGRSRVALMSTMPPRLPDLTKNFARLVGEGSDEEPQQRFDARTACLNDVRRSVADRTGAIWLDVEQAVCSEDGCPRELDGMILRPDGVHFEGESARWLARWMLSQVGVLEKD